MKFLPKYNSVKREGESKSPKYQDFYKADRETLLVKRIAPAITFIADFEWFRLNCYKYLYSSYMLFYCNSMSDCSNPMFDCFISKAIIRNIQNINKIEFIK